MPNVISFYIDRDNFKVYGFFEILFVGCNYIGIGSDKSSLANGSSRDSEKGMLSWRPLLALQ